MLTSKAASVSLLNMSHIKLECAIKYFERVIPTQLKHRGF